MSELVKKNKHVVKTDDKDLKFMDLLDHEEKAGQPEVKKIKNKYHLPVLNVNKDEYWESKPLKERRHLTDEVAMKTCLGNCCGYEGLSAGCCTLDPEDLEHVLGSISEDDIKLIIKNLKKVFPEISREDIVIEQEEGMALGKSLFGGHKVFEQPTSYPMLRLQTMGPRYACKFLNPKTFKCQIYSFRPKMCVFYYCQYLKSNFLIKTNNNKLSPWEKVR
jgi:Fe-S-cluster containining protein